MGSGTRTALYVPFFVSIMLVLVPYALLSSGGTFSLASPAQALCGSLLIVLGLSAGSWTIWDLAVSGRGTPNPLDPPRELVTRGLYRYVRNPMALGFVTTLLGQAALFHSIALLTYALIAFGAVHLLVVLHEEPAHRRRFGAAFETYCSAVPRWMPRLGASRRTPPSPG